MRLALFAPFLSVLFTINSGGSLQAGSRPEIQLVQAAKPLDKAQKEARIKAAIAQLEAVGVTQSELEDFLVEEALDDACQARKEQEEDTEQEMRDYRR
ncbi:MAG: hypothetical protein JWM36_679 [Hyphomicrobiales bacterium]|nr:hypothetical protein [Hyphomicrobiales bacterium]